MEEFQGATTPPSLPVPMCPIPKSLMTHEYSGNSMIFKKEDWHFKLLSPGVT